MAKTQQEPTIPPSTDETPPSTFGDKLHQYAFISKSPASPPKRQQPISAYLTPTKTRSQSAFPSKRKSSSPTKTTPQKRKSSPPTKTTPQKKRKKRPSSSTTYHHHPNNLTDTLTPHLLILFIGCNPGLQTALTGHAYAHPSNLFYKLLYASTITPRLCTPSQSPLFPSLYSLGLTNIVTRPTRDASELSKEEMDAGVGVLEEKCRTWKPEVVCVVGKGVWESVWRVRYGGGKGFAKGKGRGGFRYGWQEEGVRMGRVEGEGGWEGSRVFVATTTSGLAAGMGWGEKVEVWRELGEWVGRRRGERERERAVEGGREGDGEGGVGEGEIDGGEEEAVK